MKVVRLSCAALVILLLASTLGVSQGTPTTPRAGEMNAHYINVGQGAAVLLEFACGAALIDTGGEMNDRFNSTETLKRYLDGFFSRRTDLNSKLEMVVISHAHIDHTRGLSTVLDNYDVSLLIDNGLEKGSGGRQQKAAHARARASGGSLKWQSVQQSDGKNDTPPPSTLRCSQTAPKFTYMWGALSARDGWSKGIMDNGNDSSVVTRLDFGKASFLFPGDLEEDVQGDLIEDTCPNGLNTECLLDVDVYHVSHHGSHNGTTSELVEAMTPRVAVFSMGPRTRKGSFTAAAHGHPRKAILQLLLDPTHGVHDTRPPIDVFVANRGESKQPKPGPQFSKATINRAIYGTGWDDNVVVTAKSSGALQVLTVMTQPGT